MEGLEKLSEWSGRQINRRRVLKWLLSSSAALSGLAVPDVARASSGTKPSSSQSTVYRHQFFAVDRGGPAVAARPEHCCPWFDCRLVACQDCLDCTNCGDLYRCTDLCPNGDVHYECTILPYPYRCWNYSYC